MKLIRFGNLGAEKAGVILADGKMIDVSNCVSNYDEAFFESNGLERLQAWLLENAAHAPAIPDGIRLGSPIARPSKIICIGLNYKDHAAESKMHLHRPWITSRATCFTTTTASASGNSSAVDSG